MSAGMKKSLRRDKPAKDYSTRVSISLPPKLLRELDEATRRNGYGERSKALQIAIRTFIDQSRVAESPDSYAT